MRTMYIELFLIEWVCYKCFTYSEYVTFATTRPNLKLQALCFSYARLSPHGFQRQEKYDLFFVKIQIRSSKSSMIFKTYCRFVCDLQRP